MSLDDADAVRRLGTAFATGGDRYQQLRPGYPDRAVEWLVAGVPEGGRVVDVGAGTGKLSGALAGRGFAVLAVDPSTDMLAQLRRRLPALQISVGTGEDTGVTAGSADLVTFAQSWHWVEPTAGTAEIQRILKPGGRAGWLWNFLDVRVNWVAELVAIWHTLSGSEVVDPTRHAPVLTAAFEPVETCCVDWQQPMERADVAGLVSTRSYYLGAPAGAQRRVREETAALVADRFPDADRVDLPYRTHCYRTGLDRARD